MSVLIDTNILLDIFEESEWARWSASQLQAAAASGELCINFIVYAELAPSFSSADELNTELSRMKITVQNVNRQAAFRASTAYRSYKQNKGTKDSILADFFIGAHAETNGLQILTRDPKRFRTYFPEVPLVTPN